MTLFFNTHAPYQVSTIIRDLLVTAGGIRMCGMPHFYCTSITFPYILYSVQPGRNQSEPVLAAQSPAVADFKLRQKYQKKTGYQRDFITHTYLYPR